MFDLRPFVHERYGEIDSTNSEGLRRIGRGEIDRPIAISAEIQTAGRGSGQRSWSSHGGNVHASFLLPVREVRREAFLIVYPLALATSRTIREATGLGGRVALKWPNDVLIDGHKVSGSLHEVGWHGRRATLVAGIGINVRWSPELTDAAFPPGALVDFVADPPEAEALVERLGTAIMDEIGRWQEDGFEAVRRRYHEESCLLGRPIAITERTAAATRHEGVYRGIDDDGALLLEGPEGTSKHYSVDVFPTLGTLAGN